MQTFGLKPLEESQNVRRGGKSQCKLQKWKVENGKCKMFIGINK